MCVVSCFVMFKNYSYLSTKRSDQVSPHICTNFCAELEAGIQAKSWSATASEFQLLI